LGKLLSREVFSGKIVKTFGFKSGGRETVVYNLWLLCNRIHKFAAEGDSSSNTKQRVGALFRVKDERAVLSPPDANTTGISLP